MKRNTFDVVIIGAGPAGCACAVWLIKLGLSVAVIEKFGSKSAERYEILAPEIKLYLADLDVEFSYPQYNDCMAIRSIWGNNDMDEYSYINNPYGAGINVLRTRFDSKLCEAAKKKGTRFFTAIQLMNYTWLNNFWQIYFYSVHTLKESEVSSIQCKMIVDATGRRSVLGMRLGARRLLFDNMVAISVKYDSSHDLFGNDVYIESFEDGWWYCTAGKPNTATVLLMTDGDIYKQNQLKNYSRFQDKLAKTKNIQAKVGNCLPGLPVVFNAASHRLRRKTYNQNWLAIGDAALAIDPLSGKGMVYALESAKQAAFVTSNFLNNSTSTVIQEYEYNLDNQCLTYLFDRYNHYSIENRWREHLFWKRRIISPSQLFNE